MSRSSRREDRLREFRDACRREGIPLTAQRSIILEALAARDDHPTADQLLEDVREKLPGISRTTVYRVLETLTRLGFAGKTCAPGSSVRFDPCTERHHHLVCVQCERVLDLHAPALDALPLPKIRRESGFEIRDYSVYFQGLCAECRRNPRGERRARTRGHGPRKQPRRKP